MAAASWLRIGELSTSFAELVCITARVQSINSTQRTLILYDDNSSLLVSLANLRTPFDIQSTILPPGQCVQIYGKVIRRAGEIIRIEGYFIRQLGNDFDLDEYARGLILMRNYMASIDGAVGSVDNSGNAFRTIL